MLVAALDTTTRAGSVALAEDGRPLDVQVGDPGRPHAERLPGDLIDLLRRNGRQLREVDVFAVAAGPGSFTGLRIGIATIQGLSFATARPVVAVSALEALACAGARTAHLAQGDHIAAVMDAQRGEVFSAVYRVAGEASVAGGSAPFDELAQVEDAAVAVPDLMLGQWRDAPWFAGLELAGDGALAYRDVIVAGGGGGIHIVEPTPPLSPAIAFISWRRALSGDTIAPHAIRPVYVRRPDAELARERRRKG
jgi:tRNA threonylcarbamoyladenosine biosynthesis protein TsaB